MNKSYFRACNVTIISDQNGTLRTHENVSNIEDLLINENKREILNDYYDYTEQTINLNNKGRVAVINTLVGLGTFLTLGYFAARKMDWSVVNDMSFFEVSLAPIAISSTGLYMLNIIKSENEKLKSDLEAIKTELIKLQNEFFTLQRNKIPTRIINSEAKYISTDAHELVPLIDEQNKVKKFVLSNN